MATMQGSELDVYKEIPGYKAILKAVLRNQIQMLVQQLSDQVGEEAVLLTASVSDATFSHLGSESGNVFVEDHDELKTQFLGHCLKRHHKKKTEKVNQLLGTSESVFPGSQVEPVPQFHSTPLVQRPAFPHKRLAPYRKPITGQRTISNQRQNMAAKQDDSQAGFRVDGQYHEDGRSCSESQHQTSEIIAGNVKEEGNENLTVEAVPPPDLSINDSLLDEDSASQNVKREPGERIGDLINADNAGNESMTEGISGQWDATVAQGDQSFDPTNQEYVDGQSAGGGFRMVLVNKREKKSRHPLTLEQRVYALKLLSTGLSARKTAMAMGVGRSQIQEIFKHRDEIMADWQSDNVNPDRKRKSRRTGNEEINSMCLKWYQEAVANGYSISGPELQQKALELAVQLGISSFKASNGWLESFRRRHMIVTAGQTPKTSAADKKNKTASEGIDIQQIDKVLFPEGKTQQVDKVLFPEGKTKVLDESYIQEHVDRALKTLDVWRDEGKDAVCCRDLPSINEMEHAYGKDAGSENVISENNKPDLQMTKMEATDLNLQHEASDSINFQTNITENIGFETSQSKSTDDDKTALDTLADAANSLNVKAETINRIGENNGMESTSL